MSKKHLFIIAQVVFVILFFALWFLAPSGNCEAENSLKKEKFNGNVVKKYIDREQHLYPTLKLANYNRIVVVDYDKSGFYPFVQIGDSLIKEKGSLDIRLIRNELDTVFTIDYGCED